jgi:hypothetical protein
MQGKTRTRLNSARVFTKSHPNTLTRKKRSAKCKSPPIIQNIIKEWKAQTRGTVKKSSPGKYGCDYYLSNGNQDNTKSHVHLITKNYFDNTTQRKKKNNKVGYCIKKNGKHCASTFIQPASSAKQIVGKMRKSMKKSGCKVI